MSLADDIINHQMPDFDSYLKAGVALDDIDEYGLTPLIEAVITAQPFVAEKLLERGVDVNKPDITGRTPLHWATDRYDLDMVALLLSKNANPNAYTRSGMSTLVFPVLREQADLQQMLYPYGAKLDFAHDFIYAKLLGHRFELRGEVDILNARNEFIEVTYEGFILEFTVGILQDALRRFTSSYSTRQYRAWFKYLHVIMDALADAGKILQFQPQQRLSPRNLEEIARIVSEEMVILPAASQGHAMGFMKYQDWWVKVDRGENSLREGSLNIYRITRPNTFTVDFIQDFLLKKQPRNYFHKIINQILGLEHFATIPMSTQIAGNCSWANIQALVLAGFQLQTMDPAKFNYDNAKSIYDLWIEWDKDRALDECMQRFYQIGDPIRKATYASILAAVLFQALDYMREEDVERAEKILKILMLPDYYYILACYLDVYCVQRLTRKGNNLLKMLEECGVNPNIGITPIATGLKKREER